MIMNSDEENERLLGQSRKQDEAAVPILKPDHTRQEHGMSKLSFRGGPKPTNTLGASPYFRKGNEPQKTSFKPQSRNGGRPAASKPHSRGSNPSTPSTDSFFNPQTSVSPPQKRRKTEHEGGTPPDSVISLSSSLDELPPDSVKFNSNMTKSQERATVGMVLPYTDNGQHFGTPDEYLKVEALVDSRPGTRGYSELSGTVSSRQSPQEAVQNGSEQQLHVTNTPRKGTTRQVKQDSQTNITATHKRTAGVAGKPSDGTGRPSRENVLRPQDEPDKSDNLSGRFRTTKGERRGISATSNQDSLSPDELEGHNTIERTDINLASPVKRGRSRSATKSVSPVKAPSLSSHPMEPSNIRPTAFQSGRRGRKKIKRSTDFDSDVEEAPVWSVPVAAINVPGRADVLAMDHVSLAWRATDGQFLLMQAGNPINLPGRTTIQPRKLQKCIWERGGAKIRLEHSLDNSETDRILELELMSEKNVADLLQKIQNSTPVTAVAVEREKMDRIFRKRREGGQINAAKARQSDGLPDDIQMASLNHSRRVQRSREMNENIQQDRSTNIVSELVSRSNETGTSVDPRSGMTDRASVATGLTSSDSRSGSAISNLFKRQPEHNSHLRRSMRNAGVQSRRLEAPLDMPVELEPERYSKVHGLGDVWRRPLSYPRVGKKKATVEFEDLERLDEGQFLNDNLISFYLRYLEYELEENMPELSKRVYFFNTFFYERLTSSQKGHKGINYEGVQKWTRTIDLFTYDFVIVPINELSHWYVAVICNLPALDRRMAMSEEPSPQPEVHIKDSTGLAEKHSHTAFQGSKLESPERETTNSFAELTLECKSRGGQADDQESLTPRGDDEGQRTELNDNRDDGEMLDVPLVPNKTSLANVAQAQPMILDLERSSDPIEDPDDVEREVPLRRRQKRKSAPITCRNPDLPTIITFDSLDNPHSRTVKVLKQYLVEECQAKRGGMQFDEGQIKGVTAKGIPLQSNYSDCGLFMLGYVEKMLSTDPREFISKIIKKEYDPANDWPRLVPSDMRNSIRDQLQLLHEIEQDERRELARKAGKYHGTKSPTETPQNRASVSQQPTSKGETSGNDSKDAKRMEPKELSTVILSEKLPEDDHDSTKIKPSDQGTEKPTRLAITIDGSKSSNIDDQSVIIVESEPQTQQLEQPPSSLPPAGTTPTLSSAPNLKSSSPPPAEIPDSQSQSQSYLSQANDLAKSYTPFPTEHSQGSEVAFNGPVNGLPDLSSKDVKPVDGLPVSPSRTRRARRPSKVIEVVGHRTSPRFDVAKTTTPVINID